MKRLVVALLVGAAACQPAMNVGGGLRSQDVELAAFGQLPRAMPSADDPASPARVALGRMLYYETRLSVDRTESCNTCHLLDSYGVDHLRVSLGVRQQLGPRNAPTVYNAAGHLAQFWDGRSPTVEEQAKKPILNPVEMGMPSADSVVARLRAVRAYRAAFAAAFPGEAEPVTYDNVARAIGAFERLLVTPSRWDAFQAGDSTALSPAERAGLREFVALSCPTCHRGTYVGGGMYQKVGIVEPWPEQGDQGRWAITHQRGDRMVFKVPSLRNVERTAPYFHDGSVTSLEDAIRRMARYQVGRDVSDAEVARVAAWLRSLTGTIPEELIAPPAPPSAEAAR